MPITNLKQIAGWPSSAAPSVPAWVVDAVSEFDDPAEVRRVGVEIAVGAVCRAAGGWCAGVALLHDEPLDGDS